ncbi:LysR family transcriptional regulator [Klebsiella pneumoniae]|uniref:LysR family transcriptional regulator n=1 Tax=Klebsiella pneumoniae TaxID=573 RepID=A0A4P0XXL2_KLEPN|nr:LysR family transcriptional regulator [Klebsiella pneumoniae]
MYFTPRMVTTDMLALREAAMAGVGVVQLPLLMVRDQLASGELEVVLDEWQPRREVIHAVFASRRGCCPPSGRWWTTSAKSISGWRKIDGRQRFFVGTHM